MKTMKKHSMFVIRFLKNYEEKYPDIIKDWCSNENQEQFMKIRSQSDKSEKRRCTCYILFCLRRRKELKEQYPHLPNTKITSMLAEEWRIHRDNKDDVYLEFKKEDNKQVFFKKHRLEICEKYPHLSDKEVDLTVEKMFGKMNEIC
jgi:hypothetical protein